MHCFVFRSANTVHHECIIQLHSVCAEGRTMNIFTSWSDDATPVFIAERVQPLTVCPHVRTHCWPDFCQRWLRASLPLWLERWAVCTEYWTTQWKMSKLSLSNCWSFMGEMEVFHVGRTQKAKEGKKSVVPKFQSHLFNYFYSGLFFNFRLESQQAAKITFASEAISKTD